MRLQTCLGLRVGSSVLPSFKSYVDSGLSSKAIISTTEATTEPARALHMGFEVIYSVLFICVVGPIIAGLYFLYGAFHTEFSMALSDKRK